MKRSEEWTRINYVMELVKNEGDAQCEGAFDFLLAEINRLRTLLRMYDTANRLRAASVVVLKDSYLRPSLDEALRESDKKD